MYKTVLKKNIAEITIQKSRFISYVEPVTNEEQAKLFIESIRKKHRKATHCVPTFTIGYPYSVERCSDDGEPSGTAGVPILSMLKEEQLTNLCIVVVRYFGGIKLGTGGLVRAYTAAAKAVLENVVVKVDYYCEFTCQYDYHFHGKISYVIKEINAHLENVDYADKVTAQFYVEKDKEKSLLEQLIEATANSISTTTKNVKGAIVNKAFRSL